VTTATAAKAPDTYECSLCGDTFEFDDEWTDDDAQDERDENGWVDVDCAIVCDDCYKLAMGVRCVH